MFIWLVFIAVPLVDAVSSHDTGTAKAVTVVAAIAFVAVFVSIAVSPGQASARSARRFGRSADCWRSRSC